MKRERPNVEPARVEQVREIVRETIERVVPASESEETETRCKYEEWSGDLGEMVRCGLAEHGPKVRHRLGSCS